MRVVGLSYDDDLADAADVVVGELEDDWDCVTFDGLHTPGDYWLNPPTPRSPDGLHTNPNTGEVVELDAFRAVDVAPLDDGDGLTDDERRILAELKVELAAFDEEEPA